MYVGVYSFWIFWLMLALIVILVGIMLWREWLNARERGELLSRIMARDYQEYLQGGNLKKPAPGRNFIEHYKQQRRNLGGGDE